MTSKTYKNGRPNPTRIARIYKPLSFEDALEMTRVTPRRTERWPISFVSDDDPNGIKSTLCGSPVKVKKRRECQVIGCKSVRHHRLTQRKIYDPSGMKYVGVCEGCFQKICRKLSEERKVKADKKKARQGDDVPTNRVA